MLLSDVLKIKARNHKPGHGIVLVSTITQRKANSTNVFLFNLFKLRNKAIQLISMVACRRAYRNILGPPEVENQHSAAVERGVVKSPVWFGVIED